MLKWRAVNSLVDLSMKDILHLLLDILNVVWQYWIISYISIFFTEDLLRCHTNIIKLVLFYFCNRNPHPQFGDRYGSEGSREVKEAVGKNMCIHML